MDLQQIEKLYSENINSFGTDAKSVGWGTKEKQYLRFQKLVQVVENPQTPFTINELGCGYGELVKYFDVNNYVFTKYIGYDISFDMLEVAKKYLKDFDNVYFKNKPIIETTSDYTIASGIFNVKFEHSKESWEDYIKETLQNMFAYSDKGISFNLLTKYADYEAENLYYGDPLYFFDYCKRNLSKYVTLLHDYELYEWTIIIKK